MATSEYYVYQLDAKRVIDNLHRHLFAVRLMLASFTVDGVQFM